jgi:hypothetical protein
MVLLRGLLDLDRPAQGVIENYKSHGGRILMAKTSLRREHSPEVGALENAVPPAASALPLEEL